MISPGWGGSFIGLTVVSVVVDEIDIQGSSLLETENDASVGGDGDAPQLSRLIQKARSRSGTFRVLMASRFRLSVVPDAAEFLYIRKEKNCVARHSSPRPSCPEAEKC
jgi:hypothetical protein